MKYERKTVFRLDFWKSMVWVLIAKVIYYSISQSFLLSEITFVALIIALGFEKFFESKDVKHDLINIKKTIKIKE